jgi:hypothetical protein
VLFKALIPFLSKRFDARLIVDDQENIRRTEDGRSVERWPSGNWILFAIAKRYNMLNLFSP